jgi:kynurenine formamidase
VPTYVDLSHEISDGLVTYPGLPAPAITTHLERDETAKRLAPGVSFHIGRIDMIANTGTYLDSPWHFHADGPDLTGLRLEQLVDLPAVVVHLDGHDGPIEPAALPPGEYAGHAVLFHTGWDRHWATDRYGDPAPHLSAATATTLVERGVALAGIDSVNIDSASDPARPAHHRLLGARVLVVEHLTALGTLPERGARFTAVPPRVAKFGTFPVRAFATLPV